LGREGTGGRRGGSGPEAKYYFKIPLKKLCDEQMDLLPLVPAWGPGGSSGKRGPPAVRPLAVHTEILDDTFPRNMTELDLWADRLIYQGYQLEKTLAKYRAALGANTFPGANTA